MKKLLLTLNIQLFADEPEEEGLENEEVEKQGGTISKSKYDSVCTQLASEKRARKALEVELNDFKSKQISIDQLQNELNEVKIEKILTEKLLTMNCADIDYALFKIKKSNHELKLDDEGKLANLDEITTTLKTENPNSFKSEAEKEIEVGRVGGENPQEADSKPKSLEEALAQAYEPNKEI